MSDPQVVNTLRAKADNLQGYIAKLERDLEQARSDLAHVLATMHLFEAPADGEQHPMHYDIHRLFKPREMSALCFEALAGGPMSTVEMAEWVIARKQFPGADRHLRTSIAYKIVQALRMQEKRGVGVKRCGKRGAAIVWEML
jgi:hypothetical protein